MNKQNWKVYAIWILGVEAVGALSGFLTRSGVAIYNAQAVKPALSPPSAVFPIVWGILYLLLGVGAARIRLCAPGRDRDRALALCLIQLGVNFFWSIIFFDLRAYGVAFFWLALLWGLIVWMIRAFDRVDKGAARLQIPYLLWVSFAAWLNYGVWMLNP